MRGTWHRFLFKCIWIGLRTFSLKKMLAYQRMLLSQPENWYSIRRKSLVLFAWGCALLLLFVGATGCGDSRPRRVPVSGRVTFEGVPVGANPVAMWPARISFLPTTTGEGSPLRPASSNLETSGGRYQLSSFGPGDGVLPGEYHVVIVSMLSGPTMGNPTAPEVWEIPKRYGRPGQSGLSATVPDQRTPMTFDFELQP